MRIKRAMTVSRPAQELYAFWRNLENLPRFMTHLERVTVEDGGKWSHWVMRLPGGKTASWDAELTEEVEGERIAWRSLPGSQVTNEGAVVFKPAPADRGTEIYVTVRYDPPGGVLGDAVASLFEEGIAEQVQNELRHFKMLVETGEVATIAGQPTGTK